MQIFLYFLPFYVIIHQCTSDVDFDWDDGKPQPTPFEDWDYIVYSQRWPITACTDWEERKKTNVCNLPVDPDIWTVHGVWPSKIGKEGPYFCDSAIHFDRSQLDPIMNELKLYWTNIEGNTDPYSFWKHEWDKHGTCASVLPQLNSVTNFFNRGLFWNQKYKLTDILSKSNIVPSSQGYKVEDMFNGLKSVLGKNPTVQCVVDSKTKESLISEIRICFNKDLELIDCNVTKSVELENDYDNLLTNCNLNKAIMYHSNVTYWNDSNDFEDDDDDEVYVEKCLEDNRYEQKLQAIYNGIRFLIWFTL